MQQNCAIFTRPTLSCYNRILARLDPLKNLCTTNPEGPLESGNLRANPGLCIAGSGWVLVSGIFLLFHPHFLSKPISPDSLPQRLTCVDCIGLSCLLPSGWALPMGGPFRKLRSWPLVPSLHGKWGNIGNSDRLYFLGSKITVDGDCSHEIKRCMLLGRIAMTNLDSILKSRDITLLTKVCLVKAMVFPVVMYGCERWTVKKAEH